MFLSGSNLYGTRRFFLSGTRRLYLDSLAEYRSPNSPLLVPPLLRLGFVGVLISVTLALVIKRAGYTHTSRDPRLRVSGIQNETEPPRLLFSLTISFPAFGSLPRVKYKVAR